MAPNGILTPFGMLLVAEGDSKKLLSMGQNGMAIGAKLLLSGLSM